MSSLYRRLSDELRAGIDGGTYPPGVAAAVGERAG